MALKIYQKTLTHWAGIVKTVNVRDNVKKGFDKNMNVTKLFNVSKRVPMLLSH